MNVVDSSGWLEYLAEGINADHFATTVNDVERLIVPTIAIYEVVRWTLRERGEAAAATAMAIMTGGILVDLDQKLAIAAAQLSIAHHLAMADAIILATAHRFEATLWTQDTDFEGLDKVRYFAKTAE